MTPRKSLRMSRWGVHMPNYVTSSRPTEAEFRRAQKLIPQDTRDLTARMLGDPLPGRSALDRARQ